MAKKTKPRFAIPSQFGSDDDDPRTKSTRTNSPEFQPGQLFAQARKDHGSLAKKDVYSTKNDLSSNKTTSSNPSSASTSSSLPSTTSSLPSSTSSLPSSTSSFTASLPSTSSAFSSRKAAAFGATKTPTSSASPTPAATVHSTNSSSSISTAPSISSSSSSSSSKTGPCFSAGAKKNAMIVNPKQRGNPILKFVTNVPWEYGDIVPDYQVGLTACVLFLSLRYHNLNPDYIHKRLDDLKNMYELRVLLVQVDVNDPHHSLKELALLCILANCTLMVAWTPEEAGKYLETYKSYESKPPDAIMARAEDDFQGQMADTLTTVKGINKTDATTLLSTFDSLANIIECEEDKLLLCPGLGPLKAKRLHQLFDTPFKNWK